MIAQILVDGVLNGSIVALGAIGLTLTYGVLRFANFVHGELLTIGAYLTLVLAASFAPWLGDGGTGALSFGAALLAALPFAALGTGLAAVVIDAILFRRLRRGSTAIGMVIASFGASLALRSAVEFGFGGAPRLYSRDIVMAVRIGPVRATPDAIALLLLMLALMVALHLLMTRAGIGRSMRAVSLNADLARLCGIDVDAVVRYTWLLGGGLAAIAGVSLGITEQLRPYMGFDLLLPMFAAAILGGIGSVPGAMLGGMVVGVGEALAVPLIGADYRAAVAFLVLLAVLLLRPQGVFAPKS